MIHVVGERHANRLKVFTRDGSLFKIYPAGFDAWGNYGFSDDDSPPVPPWGHACWMPPGHYVLQPVQSFDPPTASEGYGQIPVADLDAAILGSLVKSQDATARGLAATIGGIEAPIVQLATFERAGIMIHGGGSNATDPFDDIQGLYRTFGCTRMLNGDWRELAVWLMPLFAGNVIVYTALEQPQNLGQ